MMIQVHSTKKPYIEHKTKRVFRVLAKECFLKADWFGSDCMDKFQKRNLETLPVSLCVLSKFDNQELINRTYGDFYDDYKKDSEELYGVIKYFDGVSPYISLTILVSQLGLNMCRHGVNKIQAGESPGFILHISTTPDLRWDSRNPPFDYNDFINGKHYYIEDLTYQIIKVP